MYKKKIIFNIIFIFILFMHYSCSLLKETARQPQFEVLEGKGVDMLIMGRRRIDLLKKSHYCPSTNPHAEISPKTKFMQRKGVWEYVENGYEVR